MVAVKALCHSVQEAIAISWSDIAGHRRLWNCRVFEPTFTSYDTHWFIGLSSVARSSVSMQAFVTGRIHVQLMSGP